MKYLLFGLFLLAATPLCAQTVVLLCTKTPTGSSCVPVDTTHPLPVVISP